MTDIINELGITPGPWEASNADMFGDHNIQRHDSEDRAAIAAVVSNLRPVEEVAANARAISEVPEILAYLGRVAEMQPVKDENGEVEPDVNAMTSFSGAEIMKARAILHRIKTGEEL